MPTLSWINRSKSTAGEKGDKKAKRKSSLFNGFSEKKTSPPNTTDEKPSDDAKPGVLTRAASSFLPDHNEHRPEVESMFTQLSEVLQATMRPLPTAGDGQYHESKKEKSGWFDDLKTFGITDFKTLGEVIKQKATGELIDDKTYMMERIIQLVADLPAGSANRITLTNDFIDQLWDSLQHPPLTYLSDKFMYRQPDGSYNNIQYPHLGQAGQPYARSVRPMQMRQGAKPDAGLIFDAVFARYDYKPHPNNVSSMLFYIASIIIHDIFRTDFRNHDFSSSSSYLDLAPLYGSSEEELALVRSFKDGKLKPDSFSERRLLGFPPGVSCLLIMFNRFHNYVAETIAEINEGGRFNLPFGREKDPEAHKKRENDIFQTARLITSGLYINIILTDYLRTIVNLNRVNSTWTLDPRADMEKAFGDDGTPRGVGNQVPVEFNLVYRWHSTISKRDEEWTEEFYKKLFEGQDPHNVDWKMLLMGLGKWERSIPQDPVERTFNDLKRGEDGKFNDDDLVKILKESIEDCAGNFGANNVPIIMKAVEILGIEQARKWKCASLNEFRNFFGLASHKTFEDINPDPKVADNLKRLYDHPDFVELYPGIVAEQAKTPMVPGVGICPTFTISRAILSDAVTLVRGDRFYTVDYTPANLTNWGYSEVACDFNINQGCVFHKLFLKAFPKHFKYNSIYAFYPLTTPKENHKIMTSLGRVQDFDFDPPERQADRINVSSYAAYKTILNNQDVFKITWGKAFDYMLQGHTWCLSGDRAENAQQKTQMHHAVYGAENWRKQVFEFYEWITTKLLKERSYEIANTHMVDAVRDVINIAHTWFSATMFALPMKTAEHPRGVYSEQELYLILSVMFTFCFFDLEPTKSFALHKAARQVAAQLAKLVQTNVAAINKTGFIKNIMNNAQDSHTPLRDFGVHTIRRLLDQGKSPEEIAWEIVPTSAAMVSNQAQVFSQILDLYLSPEYNHHLADIHRLAKQGGEEAHAKLKRYVLEGGRIAGTFGLYRQADRDFELKDGDKNFSLKKGDTVFVNFITASRDPEKFPDPLEIKLNRPEENYIQYGDGPHKCLGHEASITGLTAMLKAFGKLENLRRGPGLAGQLKTLPRPGGFKVYMKEDWSAMWPFPTTMKIQFDGGL